MRYVIFSFKNGFLEKGRYPIFDEEIDAMRHLQEDWEDRLNTLIARQNSLCGNETSCETSLGFDEIDYEQTYHEDRYAVISDWKGSKIEWHLMEIGESISMEAEW